jgi:hypothetical protein
MQVRFGGGVIDARGSIAGNTFSRNANGAYARARTAPTNPQTTPQGDVRDLLSLNAQTWRELTDAQRDAWIAAATTIQGQYTNKLGIVQQYTGQQLYMKVNQLHAAWTLGGGGGGTDTDTNPPPLTPSPPSVSFGSASLTSDADGIIQTAVLQVSAAAADNQVMLYGSAPVSPGTMRPSSAAPYRLLASLEDVVVGAASINWEAAYNTVYGANVPVGMAVFLKLVRLSSTSWRTASPVYIKVVATLAP